MEIKPIHSEADYQAGLKRNRKIIRIPTGYS